jgi:hypothetical protein
MVLFNETEATLLLDLYLHFRSNAQNLTSGGVLLKMHARDELTRAMNRFFKREAPWTGALGLVALGVVPKSAVANQT